MPKLKLVEVKAEMQRRPSPYWEGLQAAIHEDIRRSNNYIHRRLAQIQALGAEPKLRVVGGGKSGKDVIPNGSSNGG